MGFKTIKKIFIVRVCLWMVILASTLYWVVWSFKLYIDNGDFMDPYYYASALRPKMYGGIIISVVCILICTKLRKKSDQIKEAIKRG